MKTHLTASETQEVIELRRLQKISWRERSPYLHSLLQKQMKKVDRILETIHKEGNQLKAF